MNIKIKRFDKRKEPQSIDITYPLFEGLTLLENLIKIKTTIDPTLSFSGVCRSGVCGSCGVMVNGKPKLACSYKPNNGDIIEPLAYHDVKRDLIVDKTKSHQTLKNSHAHLHGDAILQNFPKVTLQSDCILCDSCYSACPVMAVNSDFLGPFALTKVYRYTLQSNENKKAIDAIQTRGVWDCTLCGECTLACPQGIDPKMDIMNLRSISVQNGYSDPNFANISFGDFGFNNF
ncbi:MAG: succinate dehydrogenase/fumarate reductase iron-sulfur subunit [Epsilonproteobacteria bacterium]|nr:succinate dehydrogenase/fumarate reductase iron-sulfur subunit [Campylobacterota bacterium]